MNRLFSFQQGRRDFLRGAACLAGGLAARPLWAAMKYRRDDVLAKFRAQASETDVRVKAEILRELYRIWFSHRSMEGIVYWNVPDGYAASAKPGDFSAGENVYYGGLCRFDLSPKPAYEVIRDLFDREWRTNFDRTVEGGVLSFRGFCGDYELEATSGGKTVMRSFSIAPSKGASVDVTV